MPNWKKVITSGSDASLNEITASGNISASGFVNANNFQSNGVGIASHNSDGTNKTIFGNSTKDVNIQGSTIKIGHSATSHITASGNISSSGTGNNTLGGNLIIEKRGATSAEKLFRIKEDGSERFSVDEDGFLTLTGTSNKGGMKIDLDGNGSGAPKGLEIFRNGGSVEHTMLFLEDTQGEVFEVISNGSTGTTRVYGDLEVSDDIFVADTIFHENDLNTKISFATDKITLAAGGSNHLILQNGHITASGNISASATSTGSFARIEFADGTSQTTAGGGGSTNAAGSDTQVQFNDGGTNFGGDAGLVFNKTTNTLTAGAITSSGGITAGGNISASGNVFATDLFVGGVQFTDVTTTFGHFAIGNAGQGSLNLKNITGSGNISSSGASHTFGGQTTLNQITASAFQFVGSGTAELEVQGNITASGNISSSGDTNYLGTDLYVQRDFFLGRQITHIDDTDTLIAFGNNSIALSSGGEVTFFTNGNITASGNISASGTILASGFKKNGSDVFVDISSNTNLAGGTGITLTGDTLSTTDGEIVHDNLSGFVANEHIDHSSVSITAGAGLNGGGTIASTRTLSVDSASMGGFYSASMNDFTTTGTGSFGQVTVTGQISSSGNYIGNRRFDKTSNTVVEHQGDIVYIGNTTTNNGKIYHFKSDGTWELADADAVATCDGLLAVALGGNSTTNGMLLRGMVTLDHDPGTLGDVLFLDEATGGSAGHATSTAPSGNTDIVRVIGYCLDSSNNQIWFNPSSTFVEVSA